MNIIDLPESCAPMADPLIDVSATETIPSLTVKMRRSDSLLISKVLKYTYIELVVLGIR